MRVISGVAKGKKIIHMEVGQPGTPAPKTVPNIDNIAIIVLRDILTLPTLLLISSAMIITLVFF